MDSAVTGIAEGLSKKFWFKFKNEWIRAMYTPFVVCLASGSLKIDSFRHYIAQDVYFLRAFAQAYEMAEEWASDDDDARSIICDLRKGVEEELKMHDSFVNDWGVDLSKECTPNAATIDYTDFLLATASGKVEGAKAPGELASPFEKAKLAACTIGAMTPCMTLYAFLGKALLEFLDPSEDTHPYRKWIYSYSSDMFQASALQTEELLEKLTVSLTGKECDVIEKLYYQAMRLETEFFLAQPLMQRTVIPLATELNRSKQSLVLFSDFDLTCTVVDSSTILAEIAIMKNQLLVQNHSYLSENLPVQKSASELRCTWEELCKIYAEEYEQFTESVLVYDIEETFNLEGLCKALEQLSRFNKKANLRVIDSGLLKGINIEDIKRDGERLIFRESCSPFFKSITQNENLKTHIHVLSYCWCGDLVRPAISSCGLDAVNVHANEFIYENSLSTGEIILKLESPIEKVQAFTGILQKCSKNKEYVTVYIGDSVDDLLCLLEADVGIVVGLSTSLKRLGNRFGVSFVPLFTGAVKMQKRCYEEGSSRWEKGLPGVVYTVSTWAEIHAFILGS